MFDVVGMIGRLTGEVRAAARAEVVGVGDDELCDLATAAVAARRALDAFEVHVLAELDARGVCDRDHGLSTAGWWAREASVSQASARSRVNVASKLRRLLPEVDAALSAGTIGFDHARVLADAANPRIAHHIAGLQRELLDAADGTVFDVWRRNIARVVDLLDDDGGHDPNRDLARNHLHLTPTLDGVTDISGALTAEHALVAEAALNAKADELFDRYTRDHARCPDIAIPPRATLRALAFVELCRLGQATDPATSQPPRTEVQLVAPASDPVDHHTPQGVRLPDGTTRTLACDPDVHPIIIDGLGIPLDLGRRTRTTTAAQRRAIALRDGGCVFPGCVAPIAWCDTHHLQPWHQGGLTDLANLAALCRHHHTITHRPGWTMTPTAEGRFTFTTPRGHTLTSQRHHRQPTGPAPPGQQTE